MRTARSRKRRKSVTGLRKLFEQTPRRFIPAKRVAHFFSGLNAARVQYAVLRWFDDLPNVARGEDIDLLVRDEEIATVRRHLRRRTLLDKLRKRRLVRCDLYSVSGHPSGGYRGVAYYPPELAQRILERAERHASGASVPCREDHFYSLAFHALYHKGLRSGIAVANRSFHPGERPEHDYSSTLRQLAEGLGLAVEMEMDALDAELARRGWRPPLDHLARLLAKDRWGRAKIKALSAGRRGEPGVAVFIIREEALASGGIERTSALIAAEGFVVLAAKRLSAEESGRAAREIRGGNWGRGPFPISGGPPAAAIAVLDPSPIRPDRKFLRRHPDADNVRVYALKEKIRVLGNSDRPAARKCSIVHSSDYAEQAARYIDLLMPEMGGSIAAEAARLRAKPAGTDAGAVNQPS